MVAATPPCQRVVFTQLVKAWLSLKPVLSEDSQEVVLTQPFRQQLTVGRMQGLREISNSFFIQCDCYFWKMGWLVGILSKQTGC